MSILEFTCYEYLHFIQQEAHSRKRSHNTLLLHPKVMMCYKIHINPSKICYVGPEEEVSNYVVKPARKYAF